MLTDTQIEKAVNWWSAAIVEHVKNEFAEKIILSDKKINKFKIELKRVLKSEQPNILSSIFNPDDNLTTALHKSGINIYLVPWKTTMIFFQDEVRVTSSALERNADYLVL